MNEAFLLIGGNMGDRILYLQQARDAIEKDCGRIVALSAIYQTEAWGLTQQPNFLNQAIRLHTFLLPEELLKHTQAIEKRLGRIRAEKYGPRTIDIDLLLYDDLVINTPLLVLPHPGMHERRFALECLKDIAAQKLHPLFQKTIMQLYHECTDTLRVDKLS